MLKERRENKNPASSGENISKNRGFAVFQKKKRIKKKRKSAILSSCDPMLCVPSPKKASKSSFSFKNKEPIARLETKIVPTKASGYILLFFSTNHTRKAPPSRENRAPKNLETPKVIARARPGRAICEKASLTKDRRRKNSREPSLAQENPNKVMVKIPKMYSFMFV